MHYHAVLCFTGVIEPGLLTGLLQIWSLQPVSHMLQCIVRHADMMIYRGRRAIEEATQRLTRAMDRANADLGRTHRSRRGSEGGSPGNEGYPTNGHKDDEGVHKLGRTAEHDYDRYVCHPTMGDLACVYCHRPRQLLQCGSVKLPGCLLPHMVKFHTD